MSKKQPAITGIMIALLFSFAAVYAQPPQLINYQGMLTDEEGNPINGTRTIVFSLYDAATDGTALWNESQSVTIMEGVFSILLGSIAPFPCDLFGEGDLYLALTVGSDDEMAPRKQLVSVPYAFYAAETDKLDGFDSDHFVRKVDGVLPDEGNVELLEGDNITITPDTNAHTITISADCETGDWVGTVDGVSPDNGNVDLVAGSNITITPDTENHQITIAATVEAEGDNLGDHRAQQNINLDGKWLSGDGDSEGVYVDDNGNVRISGALKTDTPSSSYDSNDIVSTDDVIADGMVEAHGGGGTYGYLGGSNGVWGEYNSSFYGYVGSSRYGVYGTASGFSGVWGNNSSSGNGVHGSSSSGTGVYGSSSSGYAGYFSGNVDVTGSLSKGSGSFKIDHPLDPENKYLYHSFVESPDMMNVYNGNAVMDAAGEAIVELPRYFEALNRDFRYQLTCIGGFAQIYIAEEISGNRFKIAGGSPEMKVSWQVTGIRQDAFARAHPMEVEVNKTSDEAGKYIHPVENGAPEEKGIDYEMINILHEKPIHPKD